MAIAPSVLADMPPSTLIVVEDKGGASTMPYYEELGLLAEKQLTPVSIPHNQPVTIDAMLPIRSTLLTPGQVTPRTIQAPHFTPIFMVGDDALSRRWLIARREVLQQLGAIGLVVNVESRQALQALQARVPDLTLSAVSGDDIATRLGLKHYPVLVTSTTIEQ